MRNRRNRARLLAVVSAATIVAGYAHVTEAATFNVSWTGNVNTLYSTAGNWSGGVVPNNAGANYYNVTVNQLGGATVGLNVPATINNLTIGPGSIFIPQSNNTLTLIGSATNGPCTITNNGTFNLAQAIPWSTVTLLGSTTALNGSGITRIINGRIGGTSTLTNNQTIIGRGELGMDGLAIVNNSVITANDPAGAAQSLIVNPGGGGVTNTGTMTSADDDRLVLADGTFNNSSGHITATSGLVAFSTGAFVSGGTISAGATGEVTVAQASVFNATLSGTGAGRTRVSSGAGTFSGVTNNGTIAMQNATIGHFLGSNTNNGTVALLADTGNATLNFGAGTSTLLGGGTVLMQTGSAGFARIAGTGTFVNHNKIIGTGSFVGGRLVNHGLLRATGGGEELSIQVAGAGTNASNSGTVTVDGSAQLRITSGTWHNTGTILVNAGTMQIHAAGGGETLFNHGSITVATGGKLETSALRTLETSGGRFAINSGGVGTLLGAVNAGSIILNGTLNQTGALVAQDIAGTGTLNLTAATTTANVTSARIGRLIATGSLTVAPNGTDAGVSRLSLAVPQFIGGGRMDLSDNDLVIDYLATSPLPTVQAQIATGYDGGAWTGAQLTSSAAAANPGFALGYGEAGDVFASFPATFAGQSVDATTVLVKYTRYGDANLDGSVTLQDFNKLAANFGLTGGAVWTQGDFNYDGNVNLQDFNKLAGNFGLSAAGPSVTPDDWSALAAAVPEPAVVWALSVGLMSLRRRRG